MRSGLFYNLFGSIKVRKEFEMSRFIRILLLAFFILAISAPHLWAFQSIPEIDPSLAPSAIALLSGGLLILKRKSGKKGKKD
jgi:hypothetical protein